MSQHASFKSASKIAIKRNVLKRFERIDVLREQGKWKEGDRGQGSPKTKTIYRHGFALKAGRRA